jgi:hypothetical protein
MDRVSALTLEDGIARSDSPLYDPTWNGAAAFARYGLHPPPAPSSAPVPATPGSNGMPVIGGVSVFTVAFYRLADGGAAVCPNGAAAEAVHLVAFRDPNTHPLTDVVIENQTQRMCSMRFQLHIDGAVAYAPVVELHFAMVQDYYLSTDGFIDGEFHLLGLGVKHTHVRRPGRARSEDTVVQVGRPLHWCIRQFA